MFSGYYAIFLFGKVFKEYVSEKDNKMGLICDYCKQDILKKEKYVSLRTFDRARCIEDKCWHFQCFIDWYNKKVYEKSKNTVKDMQKMALKLFKSPQIQEVIAGTIGGETLGRMLNTDLDGKNDKIEFVKIVKKDGKRKKRSSKNRKAQMQKM